MARLATRGLGDPGLRVPGDDGRRAEVDQGSRQPVCWRPASEPRSPSRWRSTTRLQTCAPSISGSAAAWSRRARTCVPRCALVPDALRHARPELPQADVQGMRRPDRGGGPAGRASVWRDAVLVLRQPHSKILRAGCRSTTRKPSTRSKRLHDRSQIWPFVANTDDPVGDPAHPYETAAFLRDRIWSYCQDVISYVRAAHPGALFECLWPLDANQGKPSPDARLSAAADVREPAGPVEVVRIRHQVLPVRGGSITTSGRRTPSSCGRP